jgi:hypothetical protein
MSVTLVLVTGLASVSRGAGGGVKGCSIVVGGLGKEYWIEVVEE